MAYLAVNKDGTEIISDYSLYRSGYYKRYKKCDPVLCDKCTSNGISCIVDGDGKRYSRATYNSPFKMDRGKAIEVLSFWDNFEFDSDGNKIDGVETIDLDPKEFKEKALKVIEKIDNEELLRTLLIQAVEIMGESELIAHCDECGDNIYKDTLIID